MGIGPFFDALREVILTERVDALLVTGDVFDGINPSGEAQRLLNGAIAGALPPENWTV